MLLASAGAVAGELTHRAVKATGRTEAYSAVLLVSAALAYPVADLGAARGRERTRELAAVVSALATGVGAARTRPGTRRRILAMAWLSHAAFDAVHRRSSSSRLPRWYPAFCAGFDTVVAVELLRAHTPDLSDRDVAIAT